MRKVAPQAVASSALRPVASLACHRPPASRDGSAPEIATPSADGADTDTVATGERAIAKAAALVVLADTFD